MCLGVLVVKKEWKFERLPETCRIIKQAIVVSALIDILTSHAEAEIFNETVRIELRPEYDRP